MYIEFACRGAYKYAWAATSYNGGEEDAEICSGCIRHDFKNYKR
jgi:hypothetical protein